MIHDWPASLPQSPLQDFSVQPRSGLRSPDAQVCPERTRTNPEQAAQFSMIMTTAQLTVFRTWYGSTINQCGLFSVPWIGPVGHAGRYCRFSAPPQATRAGLKWRVTLPLEILDDVAATGDTGEITDPSLVDYPSGYPVCEEAPQ